MLIAKADENIFSQRPDEPLPSIEEPKGEYPTYITQVGTEQRYRPKYITFFTFVVIFYLIYITQESGKVVPVVQVKRYNSCTRVKL